MKFYFINNLQKGDKFKDEPFFLIKLKENKTKDGRQYLDVLLKDKTGEISGKVWQDNIGNIIGGEKNKIIKVDGSVDEFNGNLQVNVSKIEPLSVFEEADFFPQSDFDVTGQFKKITKAIKNIVDLPLRNLLEDIFVKDKDFAAKFCHAYGAEMAHHAWVGGLQDHIVEMLDLALVLCEHFPVLDKDLLVAGVLLHDLGKMEELDSNFGVSWTLKGHLTGHLSLGALFLEQKIKEQRAFPENLHLKLVHLVLAHHGKLEFGSPVKPQLIEALALHMIDDLSAKIDMAAKHLQKSDALKLFTDYHKLLDTKFLISKKESPISSSVDLKPEEKNQTSLQL